MAWSKFDGNYAIFKYYQDKTKTPLRLDAKIDDTDVINKYFIDTIVIDEYSISTIAIDKYLINTMPLEQLKSYRMQNQNEPKKSVPIPCTIDYSASQEVQKIIKEQIQKIQKIIKEQQIQQTQQTQQTQDYTELRSSIIAYIDNCYFIHKEKYFISYNKNCIQFWEWDLEKHCYNLVQTFQDVNIGKFKLEVSRLNSFPEYQQQYTIDNINTDENLLKALWAKNFWPMDDYTRNTKLIEILKKFKDYNKIKQILYFDLEGVESFCKKYKEHLGYYWQ